MIISLDSQKENLGKVPKRLLNKKGKVMLKESRLTEKNSTIGKYYTGTTMKDIKERQSQ